MSTRLSIRDAEESGAFAEINEALAPLGYWLGYHVIPGRGNAPDEGGGLKVYATDEALPDPADFDTEAYDDALGEGGAASARSVRQIALDFADIPFPDHEARRLALAYLDLAAHRRCNAPSPTGSMTCDLLPAHEGPHVNVEGYQWSGA